MSDRPVVWINPGVAGPGPQAHLSARGHPGVWAAILVAEAPVVDQDVIVIGGIHHPANLKLLEVADAVDGLRPRFRLG